MKGAPIPMYAAGAQLLHNYPVGPLSGVAFNLTLLSYLGNLDMGMNTDAAAVTEPALMKRCLDGAIDRLSGDRRLTGGQPGRGSGVQGQDGSEATGSGTSINATGSAVSKVRTSRSRSATSPDETSSRRIIRARAPSMTLNAS